MFVKADPELLDALHGAGFVRDADYVAAAVMREVDNQGRVKFFMPKVKYDQARAKFGANRFDVMVRVVK